jgi:hypothetical protein
VNLPLDNSRIIISNENEANSRNKIDFPLEKKTIFNKVKGKLNLIVHFVSSIQSLENITDLVQLSNLLPNGSRSNSIASTMIAAATAPCQTVYIFIEKNYIIL